MPSSVVDSLPDVFVQNGLSLLSFGHDVILAKKHYYTEPKPVMIFTFEPLWYDSFDFKSRVKVQLNRIKISN